MINVIERFKFIWSNGEKFSSNTSKIGRICMNMHPISMSCPRCKSHPKAIDGHVIFPLCSRCMCIEQPGWDKIEKNSYKEKELSHHEKALFIVEVKIGPHERKTIVITEDDVMQLAEQKAEKDCVCNPKATAESLTNLQA